MFVYTVPLPFKTNHLNIMFDKKKKKKRLTVLCGTHAFWVETTGSAQQLRAAFLATAR